MDDHAPDFLGNRLDTVEVDYVVAPSMVAVVSASESFDLVSVPTELHPVRAGGDPGEIFLEMVVVQQVVREPDGGWDQEDLAPSGLLSIVQDHEVEAHGRRGEGPGRARLDHGPREVCAPDLRAPAVLDDR